RIYFLAGCAGSETATIGLRDTKYASWPQQALALFEQSGPDLLMQHTNKTARVDQIEALVGKIQRLTDIHHAKGGVVSALRPRSCIRIVNHRSTDINPGHLSLRILKRGIKHPAARSTSQIQYSAKSLRMVLFSQRSFHSLRDHPIQVD